MELKIVEFFNHLGAGTIVDQICRVIGSLWFVVIFWVVLVLIALIFDRQNGKWIFFGSIIAFLVYFIVNDFILKSTIANFYFRERPHLAYPSLIINSGEGWIDSSFPSGHMGSTLAILTLFGYFYRQAWFKIFALMFILIMVFDRLHNGMHYPTDILAGTVFGICYGLLTIYIINKIRKKSITA